MKIEKKNHYFVFTPEEEDEIYQLGVVMRFLKLINSEKDKESKDFALKVDAESFYTQVCKLAYGMKL